MRLNGVQIGTEDSKKLAEFYTKVLGKPDWDMGEWFGWGDNESALMIGPHSDASGKSPNPARMMLYFNVSDVKSEFDRVKSCGAEVIAEPYNPDPDKMSDFWLATLADPDGNYIQLATPWDGAQ